MLLHPDCIGRDPPRTERFPTGGTMLATTLVHEGLRPDPSPAPDPAAHATRFRACGQIHPSRLQLEDRSSREAPHTSSSGSLGGRRRYRGRNIPTALRASLPSSVVAAA